MKKEVITVDKLEAVIERISGNLEKVMFQSSVYALQKIGAEGTKELKQALSERHGATPKSPDYENAPVGDPPYMHSGKLRNTVGNVVVGNEKEQYVKCGSGAGLTPVEYAEPLNDGLHPFLYIAEAEVNPEKYDEAFSEKFDELTKGGAL